VLEKRGLDPDALVQLPSLDTRCTICYSTHVIPFRLSFQPGVALYEQVVYAARKAVISGQMRPGDPFPSVRVLSSALKINPNTAHKVITHLVNEGLLEVRPGTGTVVAQPSRSTAAERTHLLDNELEHLVVEARRLGMKIDDVIGALKAHWTRLEPAAEAGPNPTSKGARKE
jgi:GntR family transcriptional regulator